MSATPEVRYVQVAVHPYHNEYVVAGFIRVALENEQIDAEVTVTPVAPRARTSRRWTRRRTGAWTTRPTTTACATPPASPARTPPRPSRRPVRGIDDE